MKHVIFACILAVGVGTGYYWIEVQQQRHQDDLRNQQIRQTVERVVKDLHPSANGKDGVTGK